MCKEGEIRLSRPPEIYNLPEPSTASFVRHKESIRFTPQPSPGNYQVGAGNGEPTHEGETIKTYPSPVPSRAIASVRTAGQNLEWTNGEIKGEIFKEEQYSSFQVDLGRDASRDRSKLISDFGYFRLWWLCRSELTSGVSRSWVKDNS